MYVFKRNRLRFVGTFPINLLPSEADEGGIIAIYEATNCTYVTRNPLGSSAIWFSGLAEPGLTEPGLVEPNLTEPGLTQPGFVKPALT